VVGAAFACYASAVPRRRLLSAILVGALAAVHTVALESRPPDDAGSAAAGGDQPALHQGGRPEARLARPPRARSGAGLPWAMLLGLPRATAAAPLPPSGADAYTWFEARPLHVSRRGSGGRSARGPPGYGSPSFES
jgi:hypothetical protein